jgi:PTH2 family peptidyl-tRNA hydrolase
MARQADLLMLLQDLDARSPRSRLPSRKKPRGSRTYNEHVHDLGCGQDLTAPITVTDHDDIMVVGQSSSAFRFKQIIVVRSDLKMSPGKTAVQVAHASVAAAEEAREARKRWWAAWMKEGQCKVTVKVETERELLELKAEAEAARLPTALIQDRGLTELPPNTTTCLGIGPAPSDEVDAITGKLRLL